MGLLSLGTTTTLTVGFLLLHQASFCHGQEEEARAILPVSYEYKSCAPAVEDDLAHYRGFDYTFDHASKCWSQDSRNQVAYSITYELYGGLPGATEPRSYPIQTGATVFSLLGGSGCLGERTDFFDTNRMNPEDECVKSALRIADNGRLVQHKTSVVQVCYNVSTAERMMDDALTFEGKTCNSVPLVVSLDKEDPVTKVEFVGSWILLSPSVLMPSSYISDEPDKACNAVNCIFESGTLELKAYWLDRSANATHDLGGELSRMVRLGSDIPPSGEKLVKDYGDFVVYTNGYSQHSATRLDDSAFERSITEWEWTSISDVAVSLGALAGGRLLHREYESISLGCTILSNGTCINTPWTGPTSYPVETAQTAAPEELVVPDLLPGGGETTGPTVTSVEPGVSIEAVATVITTAFDTLFDVAGIAFNASTAQENCQAEWVETLICLVQTSCSFTDSCPASAYSSTDGGNSAPTDCSVLSKSLCEQLSGEGCCLYKCANQLQNTATCVLEGQSGVPMQCESLACEASYNEPAVESGTTPSNNVFAQEHEPPAPLLDEDQSCNTPWEDLDADGSGAVDESEFKDFVAANSGCAADADITNAAGGWAFFASACMACIHSIGVAAIESCCEDSSNVPSIPITETSVSICAPAKEDVGDCDLLPDCPVTLSSIQTAIETCKPQAFVCNSDCVGEGEDLGGCQSNCMVGFLLCTNSMVCDTQEQERSSGNVERSTTSTSGTTTFGVVSGLLASIVFELWY